MKSRYQFEAQDHSQTTGQGWQRLWTASMYILAILGLLVLVVTVLPVDLWIGRYLSGQWNDERGEVLIVLAGSSVGEHILGDSSYLRSEYAVMTYREGGFRSVLISGGAEAVLMRDFLQCQGIPHEAIIVEAESQSTRQNALYSKPLLEQLPGRKILLTSDYHMFRARRAFTKVGVEVTPRPIPDALKRQTRWTARWPAFLNLIQETAKIAYYFARDWI